MTVRSSPILPESIPVCRQCHNSCLTGSSRIGNDNSNISLNTVNKTDDEEWGSLFLMGLTAINPAASILHVDPFVPHDKPSRLFDSKNFQRNGYNDDNQMVNIQCKIDPIQRNIFQQGKKEAKSYESTPDDSPLSEEHPYHSLSSSNLTIRRFGTVPSLEMLGTEEDLSEKGNSSDSDNEDNLLGINNEGFNSSSELTWTAKAGMYVAEKMAFLEKLGEDYRASGGFFQRLIC